MAPRERLSFPTQPLTDDGRTRWYDTDSNGRADFAIVNNSPLSPDTRAAELLYDDDQDGHPDRRYAADAYANNPAVPHVVLLLDSIPFHVMQERYAAGDFRFLNAPQKTIAPFPSLTEICYGEILGAPPLPTVIDTQYDPRLGKRRSDLWQRVRGDRQPWERRLTYSASYAEHGLTFLDPRAWYAAELSRCKRAIDDSPQRLTFVYTASAAAMVCKFGRAGAEEVLDGARQLCLQLIHERRGAINITVMADHGHNLMPSKNVDFAPLLTKSSFRLADSVKTPQDVVLSMNGLVTCALLHTPRPAAVATALLRHEGVDLAMYKDSNDRVIVRGPNGTAAIRQTGGRYYAYEPVQGDVLNYAATVARLKATGATDANGYADEDAWFEVTRDHDWPNAPARIWEAFHRQTVSPPSLMLSLKDDYYCGKPEYERFIKMASSHGGLNQINCASFVISSTPHFSRTVPHRRILEDLMTYGTPTPTPPVVR
ncbi:MAG TPA: hypothetical protein VF595_11645 [Tepidisphaeraceae bacterium]